MLQKPFSIYRNLLRIYFKNTKNKHFTHVWGEYDITAYQEAVQEARKKRERPPSIVAYWMRCLGKVAIQVPDLMAIRKGKTLYIPEQIDVAMVIEAKMPDQTWMPMNWVFERMEEKSLVTIEEELKRASQQLRRGGMKIPPLVKHFLGNPLWIQNFFLFLAGPFIRRYINDASTAIGLTSLAHLPGQEVAFGTPISSLTLNVTLATIAQKGDRWVIGVTISVDHLIADTRSVGEFMIALYDEVKSGACLSEREPKDAPQPE